MSVNSFKEYKFDSASLKEALHGLSGRSSFNPYVYNKASVDELYSQHKFFQKLVDLIPQDANAIHPNWDTEDIEVQKIIDYCNNLEVIGEAFDRLDFLGAFTLAHTYGRKYGDGFIFIGVDDGQLPSMPVNLDKIKSVDYLIVKHKHDVSLNSYNKTVGCLLDTGEFLEFHFSRVLRFPGIKGNRDINDFNHSVIESAYCSYMDYFECLRSSKDMVQSHSLFKLGIVGLNGYLKRDKDNQNKQGLKARFDMVLKAMNDIGAILFDTKEETAEFANRNYSGIEPLLKHLQEWVVATSEMPRGKILGSAASGGLSEASEGERRTWNELIARHQNIVLKPNHLLIGKYIMISLGVKNPSLNVSYKPHYPLSAQEVAVLRKTEAEYDAIYLDRGVVLKNEVRNSRFGGTEHGEDIQVVGNVPEESEKEKEPTRGSQKEEETSFH